MENCGIEPVTVRETMRFSLGDAVFTVDPPALERYQEDESNNSSLIVAVANGAHRLLFCGDAEDFRMAEYLKTDPGQFDFVKLPHHGRYQSTLKELLNVTRARLRADYVFCGRAGGDGNDDPVIRSWRKDALDPKRAGSNPLLSE
ncbi:MAG: hypothetical protein J5878_06925 [Oscillospiraceae bacterium]|nr:hypothetical protein [Oscillospiraceae bacterium]